MVSRSSQASFSGRRWVGTATGLVTGALLVSGVTGLVFALKPVAPVLSLGVLYLLAVLPVAVVWGVPYAIAVSVASMLALNWFFLPPRHTLALRDSENWVALGVYLVTGVVVSGLAAASRRRSVCTGGRKRKLNASMLATETGSATASPQTIAAGSTASR